ncbi:GNAT family N-acetyltransferase [Pandoraea horticolens]|uniref:GNAT family N-acetyltransferase n=1 Tax=Pandoraea horticolens TaxID=2508298 RepID=UPI0012425BF0|nr:GNAT family N-acetyltransferase [Pandoraea horticolens]
MQEQVSLRAALNSDLPFLLTLRKLTMTEHLLRVGLATDDEAHCQRINANFEDAKIICQGSAPVGLLKLTRTHGMWHLWQIQLLPDRQGRGLGEAVLRGILEEARAEGASISLSVVHGNRARRLYEKLGFRPVKESSVDAQLVWQS